MAGLIRSQIPLEYFPCREIVGEWIPLDEGESALNEKRF